MASAYQQHVARWSNCTACALCERRKKVVLVRGKLPATVLFIGEAPGQSEDVLGVPFVGPAGQLLDEIIDDAVSHSDLQEPPRMAWTNLVACIPKDESNSKVSEPPLESIESCAGRLKEIVAIANPRLVVMVGKLSEKHVKPTEVHRRRYVGIVHPAAILRIDITQRGLMIQRCRSILSDAFDDLAPRT